MSAESACGRQSKSPRVSVELNRKTRPSPFCGRHRKRDHCKYTHRRNLSPAKRADIIFRVLLYAYAWSLTLSPANGLRSYSCFPPCARIEHVRKIRSCSPSGQIWSSGIRSMVMGRPRFVEGSRLVVKPLEKRAVYRKRLYTALTSFMPFSYSAGSSGRSVVVSSFATASS